MPPNGPYPPSSALSDYGRVVLQFVGLTPRPAHTWSPHSQVHLIDCWINSLAMHLEQIAVPGLSKIGNSLFSPKLTPQVSGRIVL